VRAARPYYLATARRSGHEPICDEVRVTMATQLQRYDDDHDQLAPVIPLFRDVVDLDEDDYDEDGLVLRFVDGYPGGPNVS
jgi:hypothetical protein